MSFELIGTDSRENKKFKTCTNDFKVTIIEPFEDPRDMYDIFRELIRT